MLNIKKTISRVVCSLFVFNIMAVNVSAATVSTNAYLSELKVKGITVPNFNENTTNYVINASGSLTTSDISYVLSDNSASAEVQEVNQAWTPELITGKTLLW